MPFVRPVSDSFLLKAEEMKKKSLENCLIFTIYLLLCLYATGISMLCICYSGLSVVLGWIAIDSSGNRATQHALRVKKKQIFIKIRHYVTYDRCIFRPGVTSNQFDSSKSWLQNILRFNEWKSYDVRFNLFRLNNRLCCCHCYLFYHALSRVLHTFTQSREQIWSDSQSGSYHVAHQKESETSENAF